MSNTLMFVITFSGIWALVGAVFFIIGIVMLNKSNKKKINCTSSIYGKVTDIVRNQSYDEYSSSWHPVFEYNIGELKFIKKYPYGSSKSKYEIGQEVEIHYNPEDYNEYYINGDTLPKTIATIFTIVGIGAISIAVISAILIICIR